MKSRRNFWQSATPPHKNEEGEEVIHFLKRTLLPTNDPRYETPRHPRRRIAHGITSESLRFSTLAE